MSGDVPLRVAAQALLDAEEEMTANADTTVGEAVIERFYRAKVALRAALAAADTRTVLVPIGPECPHCDLPKDHEGECVPVGGWVRGAAADTTPVRSCCGQPHTGAECPDGLVSCCLCFERVPKDRLHLLPNGARENVCDDCAAADGTTPTPDEVLREGVTEDYEYLKGKSIFGSLILDAPAGTRVRVVVATPASEHLHHDHDDEDDDQQGDEAHP